MFAPANTPPEILNRLHAEVRAAFANTAFGERLQTLGVRMVRARLPVLNGPSICAQPPREIALGQAGPSTVPQQQPRKGLHLRILRTLGDHDTWRIPVEFTAASTLAWRYSAFARAAAGPRTASARLRRGLTFVKRERIRRLAAP